MTNIPPQANALRSSAHQATRPARALIGWMRSSEAQLMLAQRVAGLAENPVHKNCALAAREAVAARSAAESDFESVTEPAEALAEYISDFLAQPESQPFLQEGWSIKIVDLRKVVAAQEVVYWDDAVERTRDLDDVNLLSIAKLTLPIRKKNDQLPVQFDPTRQTWMVSSRNPNLRLMGSFSGPVDVNGRTLFGYGFILDITPSFVQVARYRNVLVLRDGYHRSLGLLTRGIYLAPVLFREFGQFEPLGLGSGMLPEEAYLGDRPPYLVDYLDTTVAATIDLPASQNMILIQGLALNTLG